MNVIERTVLAACIAVVVKPAVPDLKKMSVVAVKDSVVSQFKVPPQLLVFAPPSHVRFWPIAVNGEASRANARAAARKNRMAAIPREARWIEPQSVVLEGFI